MQLFSLFFFALTFAGANELSEEAAQRITQELPELRLSTKDFKISSGWELPLTIPLIEDFFTNPFNLPRTGSQWADDIEKAKTSVALFDVAAQILRREPSPELEMTISPSIKTLHKIPEEIRPAVETLLKAIATAQPLLTKAVESVPAEARRGYLSLCEWPTTESNTGDQGISSRLTKKKYTDMMAYTQDPLLSAGDRLFRALDQTLPQLQNQKISIPKKIRVKTSMGTILIAGSEDDHYKNSDLRDVALLIDLGGNNTYQAPVAAAFDNQIRIAIDFGRDVNVYAEKYRYGSAGTGAFGIGIMALPNKDGVKTLRSGSFSQGCGLGGIGALLIQGPAHLKAERNTQGVGFFGVGLLSIENSVQSTIVAKRTGQGSADVRGVGLFRFQGDETRIEGGLVQPDPREPQGAISLCQGVGFGRRAYSGGGVGLAILKGNKNSVKGSYFSQGVGYWHAFGGFRLRGDHNLIQARRYDMGSGVHSAFGHFELLGDANRVLNWGVGPAYGWDRSIGSAFVVGDNNEVQVDWGAGVASIGSLSMGYYKTNRGRFKLCDFGRGQFFRNESSYSIQIVEGEENKAQCLGEAPADPEVRRIIRNPRGLVAARGLALVEDLKLEPALWPDLPQDQAVQEARVDLESVVKKSKSKRPLEELADLIDVAAAFSLDKKTPREALGKLLSQSEEKAALFPEILEPAAIDQLIQLSIVMPAHGDVVAKSILRNLSSYSTQKQATLINFLRLSRPSLVFPGLIPLLKSPDHRLRAATLRTLGYMLNRDTGNEPGLRSSMESLLSEDEKSSLELLKKLVLADAFGLLSTCNENNAVPDRLQLLTEGPVDVTTPIGERGAAAFLNIIRSSPRNSDGIRRELQTLEEMEDEIRNAAVDIIKSTQTSDITSGLMVLGQMANPDDIVEIAPFFRHETAAVRESAAVAMGRMGDSALPFLNDVLTKGTTLEKNLVMVTIQQSVSKKTLPLLRKGLNDPSTSVRWTAIGVINELPEFLSTQKTPIAELIESRLKVEKNKQVLLGLRLALSPLK